MRERTPLYVKIAASIRQEILQGALQPGDQIPPMRHLTAEWGCTAGTIQRAYRELAEQGLIDSRPGLGSFVAPGVDKSREGPLRWASLVHRAEAFLLEGMARGFSPVEIERGFQLALDRLRSGAESSPAPAEHTLRFAGSHDLALTLLAEAHARLSPGEVMTLSFVGSLGGLMALEKGEADIAGAHLWDSESDSYNAPFVRRLLPGEPIVMVTIAHRRLGLIVPPGNPHKVQGLPDLARWKLRLVTRQRGAGTRVWLEAMARRSSLELAPMLEAPTQTDVARAIAEGTADVGPGIEAAARAYGLDFVFLTQERYDLVMRHDIWERGSVQRLVEWLRSDEATEAITALGGYDTGQSGAIHSL